MANPWFSLHLSPFYTLQESISREQDAESRTSVSCANAEAIYPAALWGYRSLYDKHYKFSIGEYENGNKKTPEKIIF